MTPNSKPNRVYSVGIICALAIEKAAVVAMLDKEHDGVPRIAGDDNDYTFGSLSGHDVAVACLPAGMTGKASAATVARDMMRSFPIKVGLMVGIAGGVWSKSKDIRLGDVVVSQPDGMHGGVVQWDFGKMERDGVFRRTGALNKPPRVLLGALQTLKTKEMMEGTRVPEYISNMTTKFPRMAKIFCYQGSEHDQLFEAGYHHDQGETCESCSLANLVMRPPREDSEPRIYYGNIASGDEVVKDGRTRDSIATRENIVCFEMEAAGLTDSFPCIVIRGICDYADSHKSKRWQPYAAATAAAYAKWLLSFTEIAQMEQLPTISATSYDVTFSLEGIPATNRFIGREEELSIMAASLLPDGASPQRRKVFIVHGMGGIGKTQLAIEYARRHSQQYSAVIWINGDSRAQLQQSLLDFLQRLPRAQLSARTVALLEQPSKDTVEDEISIDDKFDYIAEETIRWLSQKGNTKWLMIIDNVDREHEAGSRSPAEPPFSNVVKLFPPVDHGSIIVTTRLVSLKTQFRTGLKLREMNAADARAVLGQVSEDHSEIDQLVDRLQGLPLALAQASAFVEQTGMSLAAYIKHYDSKWNDLMSLQGRFPLQEYGERSLLTTWSISYEQAQQENQAAALLLKLWAFLDCNDIWYDIVKSAARFETAAPAPAWLASLAVDELSFMGAMGLLNKLSLVDRKESREDSSGYAIHSVLHSWCLYLSDEHAKDELLWLAVRLIGASVPSGRSTTYRSADRRLLPHVSQLYRQLERQVRPANAAPEISSMIDIVGVLVRQGKLGDARIIASRALDVAEAILGPDDPVSFSAVHHMAWVYTELGSFTGAAGLYKRALQGKGKLYGPDHPSTLKTLRNFGHLLLRQGKHAEANQLYLDALTSMQSSPRPKGTVHSDILDSLGFTYVSLGSTSEGKRVYEEALKTKEDLLGPDHVSTLDTVSNLALLLIKDDELAEAEVYLRRAFEGREKCTALGSDHPETIATARQLGNLLARLGRTAEAVNTLQGALATSRDTFGPEHVKTIDIRADLDALTASRTPLPTGKAVTKPGAAENSVPSLVEEPQDGVSWDQPNFKSGNDRPSTMFSPLSSPYAEPNVDVPVFRSGPDFVTPMTSEEMLEPDTVRPEFADPDFQLFDIEAFQFFPSEDFQMFEHGTASWGPNAFAADQDMNQWINDTPASLDFGAMPYNGLSVPNTRVVDPFLVVPSGASSYGPGPGIPDLGIPRKRLRTTTATHGTPSLKPLCIPVNTPTDQPYTSTWTSPPYMEPSFVCPYEIYAQVAQQSGRSEDLRSRTTTEALLIPLQTTLQNPMSGGDIQSVGSTRTQRTSRARAKGRPKKAYW